MREVFQIRAQQLQELIDDLPQSLETVQQAIAVKRAIDKNPFRDFRHRGLHAIFPVRHPNLLEGVLVLGDQLVFGLEALLKQFFHFPFPDFCGREQLAEEIVP